MTLTPTRFIAPTALTDALRILQTEADGARMLAGGSDLIIRLNDPNAASPRAIVDLKRLPPLIGIARRQGSEGSEGGGWRIGAATPCAAIGAQADLRQDWPGVVEAATLIGSDQIQGRASLGGNLCNASPAADSVPALLAAGATLELARLAEDGTVRTRHLPVEDLPAGPGRTHLAPGELLVAVHLPPSDPRQGDAYQRLIPRTEMDIAVVGCGVALWLDDAGRIARARVGLGACAPTALRVPAAEAALAGRALDEAALADLADAVRAACRPIDDKRGTATYRTRVAGVLAQRVARAAHERARQRSARASAQA